VSDAGRPQRRAGNGCEALARHVRSLVVRAERNGTVKWARVELRAYPITPELAAYTLLDKALMETTTRFLDGR
jgi:hypothetical protein